MVLRKRSAQISNIKRADIKEDELEALRELAKVVLGYSETGLALRVKDGMLNEVTKPEGILALPPGSGKGRFSSPTAGEKDSVTRRHNHARGQQEQDQKRNKG